MSRRETGVALVAAVNGICRIENRDMYNRHCATCPNGSELFSKYTGLAWRYWRVIEPARVDRDFIPVPNAVSGTRPMPGRVPCWGWRLLWKVVARTPEIIQISKGWLRAGESDESCSTESDGGDDGLSEMLFHAKCLFMVYIVYEIHLGEF